MKVVLATLLLLGASLLGSSAPLDEDFGYVDVRPGAHMFWVTYHVDQQGDWKDYPLIMWLQGGPGASGVGYGNFEEIGPYYSNGSLRQSAWTKKANLMFVDNPVGTGYSYVDSFSLYTKTNAEIADDLVALVKSVFTDYPDMAAMPFFIMAESYGGKMTVDFALALDKAIKAGEVPCNFQGVGLGDSWISPMDSVNTWGSFLYSMGFVNKEGKAHIDTAAAKTQVAVNKGRWDEATNLWGSTENVVLLWTNGINFYNVLAVEDIYQGPLMAPHTRDLTEMRPEIRALYQNHVQRFMTREYLGDLMNGPQADKWDIPDGVVWDSHGNTVFNQLTEDFMKPVVDSVINLLENTNIRVSLYTGNLDLIVDTPGTYQWVDNMKWSGKTAFNNVRRQNFYVPEYSSQAGYKQESGRFAIYTVLRSGHMIPIDAPTAALRIVDFVIGEGSDSKKEEKVKPLKKVEKSEEVKRLHNIKNNNKPETTKPKKVVAKVQGNKSTTRVALTKQIVTPESRMAHARLIDSHMNPAAPLAGKQGTYEPLIKRMNEEKKTRRTFGL